MPRLVRRLSASIAAVALALGGVAIGTAPAQADDYIAPSAWQVPASADWGTDLWIGDWSDELMSLFAGSAYIFGPTAWYRASDDALLATGQYFTPSATDAGTDIYVVQRGELLGGPYAGYTGVATSTWIHIAKKQFTQPTLTVAGEAIAGSTLTVAESGWGATPTSYDWEWRRVADNALVGSGSGTSVAGYTVTSADAAAGSIFYANVTAHLDGYQDATWATSFSQTAHLGSFAGVTTVPTVSGTGRLGTSFTASFNTAGITPAPTSVTLQWRTTDGTLIGTGASFTPTNALVGQPLYATALLERDDYQDYVTLGSAYSATVSLADQTPGAAPTISGRNVLGGTLTASVDASGWVPEPDSFDFQWFLEDGTAIPGATTATLAMTADLVGEVVYVVATAHAEDHLDYEIASAPSGRIAAPTVSVGGTLQPGGEIVVEAWGLLDSTGYTIEVHSTPQVLGSATSALDGTLTARFTLPRSLTAGAHTIVLLRDGVQVGSRTITVAAAPSTGLAATGADAGSAPLLAGMLLLAGVVLVSVRRLRRHSTSGA